MEITSLGLLFTSESFNDLFELNLPYVVIKIRTTRNNKKCRFSLTFYY